MHTEQLPRCRDLLEQLNADGHTRKIVGVRLQTDSRRVDNFVASYAE